MVWLELAKNSAKEVLCAVVTYMNTYHSARIGFEHLIGVGVVVWENVFTYRPLGESFK